MDFQNVPANKLRASRRNQPDSSHYYEPPFEADLLVHGDESLIYQQKVMANRKANLEQSLVTMALGDLSFNPSQGSFGGNVLDHSLVPFRGLPTYLRLVDTISEVLDYSAGGFHVSVARGLGGGAGDSASSFGLALLKGRKPLSVQRPLNRADLVTLWRAAANAYLAIYQTANAGPTFFLPLVDKLREANSLADQAYAAEGIAPPRDPGPGSTEVPSEPKPGTTSSNGNGLYYGLGIAAAGLVGFFAFRPTYRKAVRPTTF